MRNKNRRGLCYASSSVISICNSAEDLFRQALLKAEGKMLEASVAAELGVTKSRYDKEKTQKMEKA
jgi:hypothetical protein